MLYMDSVLEFLLGEYVENTSSGNLMVVVSSSLSMMSMPNF